VPDFRHLSHHDSRSISLPTTECNTPLHHAAEIRGTAFALLCAMRRHHEAATTAIVSALAMVIPVAGGLWARLVMLRKAAPPSEKPSEAGDERHP
jgi:hypothetical protein